MRRIAELVRSRWPNRGSSAVEIKPSARDLHGALIRNELELWYQPILDTRSGALLGFEALIRWTHPARGLVATPSFIAEAEESGLILPIGEWVLRQAAAEAARWPDAMRVAVNLSPVQVRDPALPDTVAGILRRTDLAPNRLELEITETVLLDGTPETLATLRELRAQGVRIAMDDFGTGYSSLSYIHAFPIDKIKIDKSFVAELGERAESLAIVRAVIVMGRSLGIAITAEGVETEAQLERLRQEGCAEVQGYLFSPPRPAADIPGLIQALRVAEPAGV